MGLRVIELAEGEHVVSFISLISIKYLVNWFRSLKQGMGRVPLIRFLFSVRTYKKVTIICLSYHAGIHVVLVSQTPKLTCHQYKKESC